MKFSAVRSRYRFNVFIYRVQQRARSHCLSVLDDGRPYSYSPGFCSSMLAHFCCRGCGSTDVPTKQDVSKVPAKNSRILCCCNESGNVSVCGFLCRNMVFSFCCAGSVVLAVLQFSERRQVQSFEALLSSRMQSKLSAYQHVPFYVYNLSHESNPTSRSLFSV